MNYESWIQRYDMVSDSIETKYIASIYFVFTTITTIGYGDFYAKTNHEKIFAIFLMGFGVAFYSYTISNLTSIIDSIDKRNALIESKLTSLNDFSKDINLPEETKLKIKRTILENFKENLFGDIDELNIIRELPSALRSEITLYLYKVSIKKIYFFNCRDPSFLSAIVPKLRSMKRYKFDILYQEGEVADEMYFLKKGRVAFRASNGVSFRCMGDGTYFGEHELIASVARRFSVEVTSPTANFLVLSKKEFDTVMSEFPDVLEELKQIDQVKSIKYAQSIQHSLNLFPSTDRCIFLKKIDNSDSESNEKSESEDSDLKSKGYFRSDTGVMVSNLQVNEDKAKNMNIWSDALNTRKARRSSTFFSNKKEVNEGLRMLRKRQKTIAPFINEKFTRKTNDNLKHRSATLDHRKIKTNEVKVKAFGELSPVKSQPESPVKYMKMPMSTRRSTETGRSTKEKWLYDENELSYLLGIEEAPLQDHLDMSLDNNDDIFTRISSSTLKFAEENNLIQESLSILDRGQLEVMDCLDLIETIIRSKD